MDPRSQVLLRQPEHFTAPVLLAGLPADDLLGQLPAAQGWSWQAGDQERLDERFAGRCQFGTAPNWQGQQDALLFLPKSRGLADYLLQALAAPLAGQHLYLVGEKRGGIESAARRLAAFGKPLKLDSARHCQLWQVRVETPPPEPVLAERQQSYQLQWAGDSLQVITLPGVFAHGRLDAGSRLLLEHLDQLDAEGTMLDFGCGCGILGSALKKRYPKASLNLLDNDAFALAASRLTLDSNGLSAALIAADSLAGAPDNLAAIISNPPFHQGLHTHYEASQALVQQAPQHLRQGGQLRLVANDFLPYQPLIEAAFGNCQILAERDGYRVYQATCR